MTATDKRWAATWHILLPELNRHATGPLPELLRADNKKHTVRKSAQKLRFDVGAFAHKQNVIAFLTSEGFSCACTSSFLSV